METTVWSLGCYGAKGSNKWNPLIIQCSNRFILRRFYFLVPLGGVGLRCTSFLDLGAEGFGLRALEFRAKGLGFDLRTVGRFRVEGSSYGFMVYGCGFKLW